MFLNISFILSVPLYWHTGRNPRLLFLARWRALHLYSFCYHPFFWIVFTSKILILGLWVLGTWSFFILPFYLMESITFLTPMKILIIFPFKSPSVMSINCLLGIRHGLHFVLLFDDVLVTCTPCTSFPLRFSVNPARGSCLLKPTASKRWGGKWGWTCIWPSECGAAVCLRVSAAPQDAALPLILKGLFSLFRGRYLCSRLYNKAESGAGQNYQSPPT